ncbi:hypothetical protein GDO86_014918 [Hymenochirus boettgeri]|uniref:Senataxin n=1 Tax=Hymenochirus boettgeri TaxID=247094 RepID=A0A8T2JTD7_9PIPI|nr:hypothetical protein GDO86_014918 [Hymenochirus boettgeri]
MSTCRWCTPGGPDTTNLLKKYAAKELLPDDFAGANDDLCYCMQCVVEYHRVRDELPQLHKALWQLETSRLISQLEKSMQVEIDEDDELFLVEEDGEKQLFGYTGPNFESNLRVPLLEILKYPYLLLSKHITELCTEALCKMEQANNPFQVFEKLPGVYLLLVHPHESIRRWAIMAARTQGKVDRDDFYDLQEIFTCLFKVIELGLFENPDIYSYSDIEEGKLILLPSHLYDITNYKSYWLGICMLLTVLEEEALDSLLLSPGKDNDFVQSILHIMEKNIEDECSNPFWPALHCFMIILDRLGSKVWGQLVDPIQAFQTIIASPSYNREIDSIRKSYSRPKKTEMYTDDQDCEVSCSQMVYTFNTEKKNKDTGWKKAITPEYCPNMYEEMQSLANILQSDIGQDMRVHDSTFLWFLPYVQSVMDLKELGVPYILEVIHHLYAEVKDGLNNKITQCDKVTELFILVLVSIIELHRNKKCLHLLWVSSHKWVEAIVKSSLLPAKDVQVRNSSRMIYGMSSSPTSQITSSVQHSCIQLIRRILREGYQLGQQTTCKHYLDKMNLVIRSNTARTLDLDNNEVRGLQACLQQMIKLIKDKESATPSSPLEPTTNKEKSVPFIKIERTDDDDDWYRAGSSPLPALDVKPCIAVSSSACLGVRCEATVKKEPQWVGNSETEENQPGCSTALRAEIKKEFSVQPECLLPNQKEGEACKGGKAKKDISGMLLGLSKVVEKSSRCKKKEASEKKLFSEPKTTALLSSSQIKSEPWDPGLKLPSCHDHLNSKNNGVDSFPVTKQLELLSLEPEISPSVLVSVKEESPFCPDYGFSGKLTLGLNNRKNTEILQSNSNPVSVSCDSVHSSQGDDDVPLCVLRKKLLTQKKSQLTDSQLDRDLNGLSMVAQVKCLGFPSDSSQESVATQDSVQIKRKVKGTVRPQFQDGSSSDTSDDIITISDDSEEEERPSIASVKTEKSEINKDVFPSTSSSDFPKEIESQIKPEPSTFICDEDDSQLFEFEREDEIFSAWSDSQIEHEPNGALNTLNQWGYDTDYISDDVIKKAAEAAEEQLKNSKVGSTLQKAFDNKDSVETSVEGVSLSLFYGKKKQVPTTSNTRHAQKIRVHTSPKKLSSTYLQNKKAESVLSPKKFKFKTNRAKSPLKVGSPHKALPSVIPPKKIRMCPVPASTVEKLGLKKAARKAFDLSQRSLDSLAELRSHGQSAGVVEPKRTKTKLISPQTLMGKGNKKLLACQDLQYFRQSRPKSSLNRKQVETSENKTPKPESFINKAAKNQSSSLEKTKHKTTPSLSETNLGTSRNEAKTLYSDEFLGSHKLTANTSTPANGDELGNIEMGNSSGRLYGKSMSPIEQNPPSYLSANGKESDEEDDNLFLTQADPVDMEICSQVSYDIDIGNMEDLSKLTTFSGADTNLSKMDDISDSNELPKCKHKGCPETVKVLGDNCSKHTEKVDDHHFAKPGLPPSLQKPFKPSTAKIFTSGSTSRTASLTKDLENIPQQHGSLRAKVPSAKIPTPKLTRPQLVQNRSESTHGILQPLINQSSATSHSILPEIPKFSSRPTGKSPQQHDQGWLMREVLKWKYEMFENVSQFGPPNNLCQLPLVKVPLRFSSFDEYFNVFSPLMLLNTFESLAQDWSVKRQFLKSHLCRLHLQNFCTDVKVNRGEFQVWFRDADLNMQRHPKEDDLVFLCLPERRNKSPGEEAQSIFPSVYHTGYVSRFSRSQRTQNQDKEQYTLCDLTIHTQGNLISFRDQQVECVVIGSLITTQRQYRALLQLQRSPLFRPIIHPNPADFLPRDNIANQGNLFPSLKEFNNDQKNAIERAYAMVKQHPRLPRICLIHGPPGTGKSKTIVGLLYRILMEKGSSTVPVQNFNAKNKRNRVLVCAPSNAALDDLMKKIILEFKEKCHDKKNTLGNCGDINLVRLGAEKTISSDVIKFSLDCQVNYRIARAQHDQGLHRQKEALDQKLDELNRRRAFEKCNKNTIVPLDEEIAKLSKERQLLANSLKEFRRRPQELQRNIILESHVICCTLSTSGGILLESAFRQLGQEPFSCVIVDEAGQSCEVETLIPLLHRCSKLVLVGDPEQLPPTVISMKAEDLGYGQSLMSRLCRHLESPGLKSPVLQLTVQYRMHPDICFFPSYFFYKRILKTDRATEEVRCSSDWPFQPYMVFDVADGLEQKERESFCNPQEIRVAVALIKLIKSRMKEFSFRNIGVITPYRAQKMMIINELRKAFGNDNRPCEVDTVDGFQGRQKDCIIVTCVRANSSQGGIGFLASRQRLNVTITRAKFSLFILGSLRTLMENNDWNHLIQDAQKRGALIKTKEGNYQKDINKILKLKPVVQRPPFHPTSRTDDRPEENSILLTRPKDNPTPLPCVEAPKEISQPSSNPPPRPVIHPAVDYIKEILHNKSLPSSSGTSSLPPPRAKLKDPRLARRQESNMDTTPSPSGSSKYPKTLDSTQNAPYSSSLPKRAHPAHREARSLTDEGRSSNYQNRDQERVRRRNSELETDVKRRKVSF